MKKHCLTLLTLLITASFAGAQTKVFKAVTQDMEQEFKTILQDGKLVGYLVFTLWWVVPVMVGALLMKRRDA